MPVREIYGLSAERETEGEKGREEELREGREMQIYTVKTTRE